MIQDLIMFLIRDETPFCIRPNPNSTWTNRVLTWTELFGQLPSFLSLGQRPKYGIKASVTHLFFSWRGRDHRWIMNSLLFILPRLSSLIIIWRPCLSMAYCSTYFILRPWSIIVSDNKLTHPINSPYSTSLCIVMSKHDHFVISYCMLTLVNAKLANSEML